MRKRSLQLAVLALALAPMAAPLLAAAHPLAALLIRSFFSRLCHQDAARSFVILGSSAAVCVRCLGIYWGMAAALLLRMRAVYAIKWFAFAMLLNLGDAAGEALHLHGNMPLLRLLFGLLLGFATGTVFFFADPEAKQA